MSRIPEPRLWDVKDLAAFIRATPKQIYNWRSAAPETLPTPVQLPGSRRLLWRPADVVAWVNRHVGEGDKEAKT